MIQTKRYNEKLIKKLKEKCEKIKQKVSQKFVYKDFLVNNTKKRTGHFSKAKK